MDLKGCTQCPAFYPATTEFFYKLASGKNGLHPWCKGCFGKALVANTAKKAEQYAAMKRAYYDANRERLLEYRKEWARQNVDRVRISRIRREAKRRVTVAESPMHTEEEWNRVLHYFGNVCVACYEPKKLTRDHILPVSRGGTNHISNMQPLCQNCNSSKGAKTLDYSFWFMVA